MQELTVDELTKGKKVGQSNNKIANLSRDLRRFSDGVSMGTCCFIEQLKSSKQERQASMQVVLFAVPGAFTPTCSSKHLPGFIEKAEEFKAKGVDTIACVSVNDAFVMQAWGKTAGIDGKILMLADGSADFAKVILHSKAA